MMKFIPLLLFPFFAYAGEAIVNFTPPAGWKKCAHADLGSHVKIMIVGNGNQEYPPSMNLVVEPFEGSLKDYLKIIKTFNEKKGTAGKILERLKLPQEWQVSRKSMPKQNGATSD